MTISVATSCIQRGTPIWCEVESCGRDQHRNLRAFNANRSCLLGYRPPTANAIPIIDADEQRPEDINRVHLLVPGAEARAGGVPCALWDLSDYHDLTIEPLPVPGRDWLVIP